MFNSASKNGVYYFKVETAIDFALCEDITCKKWKLNATADTINLEMFIMQRPSCVITGTPALSRDLINKCTRPYHQARHQAYILCKHALCEHEHDWNAYITDIGKLNLSTVCKG